MISNIQDIRKTLSEPATHATLVGIAAFGAAHLAEMQELSASEQAALFARLVSDSYQSHEVESVANVASQFFKIAELKSLSPLERLHFFRYLQLTFPKMPPPLVQALLEMSKAEREKLIYKAFFTPLLNRRLEGQALEWELDECVKQFRAMPDQIKEQELKVFQERLKLFPSLSDPSGLLNRRLNSYDIEEVKPLGPRFTESDDLLQFLQLLEKKRDRKEIVKKIAYIPFESNTSLSECIDLVDTRLMKLLKDFKVISLREVKLLRHATRPPLWEKYLEAFPKLETGFGDLLLEVSKQQELKLHEEFSTITSGTSLAFLLRHGKEGKIFISLFPHLTSYLDEAYIEFCALPNDKRVQFIYSYQKYELHRLPLTCGETIKDEILPMIKKAGVNEIDSRCKYLKEGMDAFANQQLNPHENLPSLNPPLEEKVNDICATVDYPNFFQQIKRIFQGGITSGEFRGLILTLNSQTWVNKELMLSKFKREILDVFPKAHLCLGVACQRYENRYDPEAFTYMEQKEPFVSFTSVLKLFEFSEELNLKSFINSKDRDEALRVYNTYLQTFPMIETQDLQLFKWLKKHLDGEKYIEILQQFAPDYAANTLVLTEIAYEDPIERLQFYQKGLDLLGEMPVVYVSLTEGDQLKLFNTLEKYKLNLSSPKKYTILFQLKNIHQQFYAVYETLLKVFPSLNTYERTELLSNLIAVPRALFPAILENLKRGCGLDLNVLALLPPLPHNDESIMAHLIKVVEEHSTQPEQLKNLLRMIEQFDRRFHFLDQVDSPLSKVFLQYTTLLTEVGVVNPWATYQEHIKRLNSKEKLPLPLIENQMHFDYSQIQEASEVTADQLPKGIDYPKLQALLKGFSNRFKRLDSRRQEVILAYLDQTLPVQFYSLEVLLRGVEDPWWRHTLTLPAVGPVSDAAWKLTMALSYISELEERDGKEPLSPRESALLHLLGQVQNCTSGKEDGLNKFVRFIPVQRATSIQGKISFAIQKNLGQIIESDQFLKKVLQLEKVQEPLHSAKYIRNRLAKELKFPLEFDKHVGGIYTNLFTKTPEELLKALFAEVKLQALYREIAAAFGRERDYWKSEEGIELYALLRNIVPKEQLKECLILVDDKEEYDVMNGITEKAAPYLLKYYKFSLL